MKVNMIIALNSQPIRLKNNLKNFAVLSALFCVVYVVTFSLRQVLKRTRENRTVSVNSHFNLRERQKENRVTLLSNHYGLP